MTRRTTLTLAILTLAACGPNLAQEPDEAFRSRVDAAITAGDTARLASLAQARCDDRSGDARRSCFEDYFLALADSGRVTLALGALERLGTMERDVEADGHGYTHVIGIRAWKPGDDVAEVFRSCSSLYQSGCYHGVIQSYLTATGEVDSSRVVDLCDEIAPAGTDNWLRFQCMHGLGHGLEMAWNWDLPRALGGCDWLGSPWDRDSCYGGAIMENAVASAPGGHHTAARALEATGDDHGHAGHGAAAEGPPQFKMRDSTDALYPCTVLDERYLRSCYLGQGGILLKHVDYDFARAAQECDRVPESARDVCYMSLGTNASGITVQDTDKAIALCNAGAREWRQWCFVGVVKNYIDVTADPDDGIAFCREVPAGVDQERCWNAVGEQLSVLFTTDLERREAICATTGDGERMCRQGAGLWPKIPPEAQPGG